MTSNIAVPTLPTSVAAMPVAMVALCAFACALSVANVYYAQPLLDALAADFGLTPAAIGGVITAAQIGSALALLFLVPLGDRMPRRALTLLQIGLLIVVLFGVSVAQNAVQLLLGMLGLGLLGTAMTQGLIAYAATVAAPSERGRVVGAAQGGVVIGLLLARVLAGGIADLAGWRMVYATSAGLMMLLAVVLWRALPAQAPLAQPLPYRQLVRSMFTLLHHNRVLRIRGTIALLMFAAFSVFWSGMVLVLSAPPFSFSHTAIGAFGLVGAAGALGAARAGSWADRGWAQRTTGAALLLLLVSWLPLFYTTTSIWALIIGVLALDLAGQAIHVTNQALILRADPHAHSRLIGCYMLFYALGSGLGAIASTSMFAHDGWPAVCGLGAALSATAWLYWWLTLPSRDRIGRLQ